MVMSSSSLQSHEKTKADCGPKNLKFHDGGPIKFNFFSHFELHPVISLKLPYVIVSEFQKIVSVGQNKYAEFFHIQC